MPARARPWLALAVALTLLTPVLAGCLGSGEDAESASVQDELPDAADEAPAFARELPATITGVDHQLTLGPDEGLESGYQVALDGERAYVAGWGAGLFTVDVSDPSQPEVLGHEPDIFGHDVWLLDTDAENRTFVAVAGTSDGIGFVDVSDPAQPELVSTILGGEGANVHNIAVVPGTSLVYNARSVDTPGVDVVDASDPEAPELVDVFNDLTCHDIDFDEANDRAFCAGVRETQIWNIEDPEAPEIVSRIYNPSITIHHWAVPTEDGDTLVIGDEFQGATNPTANACGPGVQNPATGGTATHPIGALWFYDISDPETPTPLSYVGADELHADADTCTAHFGEMIPDRDKMVVGFLAGGTYVIDFADRTAPQVIDHDPVGEVVDVQVHHGYAFGVGRERGMDVWTFAGE